MKKQHILTFAVAILATIGLTMTSTAHAQLKIMQPKVLIKTLILTGQNNHNWRASYPVLKSILDDSKMFDTHVAISPKEGEDMSNFVINFDDYELVVLDYNGDRWSAMTDSSFVRYIERGGGVVVYHAADNAFADWPLFNRVIALGGWGNRADNFGTYAYLKEGKLVKDATPGRAGSHGQQHEFTLTCRDAEHPITKGLPEEWIHAKDELYDRMRGPANIKTVLYSAYSDPSTGGSGREEPLIFTVDCGKARIFHTMLGHAASETEPNPAMECPGFRTTLLRGAEWAATGHVTQKIPDNFPNYKSLF